jgi:phosphomannomutase
VGYVRDSFVAMAQVLDLMAATQQSLAELADALPKLHIHKAVVSLDTQLLPQLFEKLTQRFSDAEAQTGDGLRLAWNDRWLLVRGSNTEPIVRLISEADDQPTAEKLCDEASSLIRELLAK